LIKPWIALTALWAMPALAQPVFFDDFDGNALLPHWNQPRPSDWQYNVSNSELNITALLNPSNPKSPVNSAVMTAAYTPPLGDFAMDVWMGWDGDPGQNYQINFSAMGTGGQLMATFGFRHAFGQPPQIFASATRTFLVAPAPPPGMYHFTISRTAAQFEFDLEGQRFAVLSDDFAIPSAGIGFFFSTPYPGQMPPMHIDRVQVVPTPGSLVLGPALVLWCGRRRNRSCLPSR
jgi:hypothetical protein